MAQLSAEGRARLLRMTFRSVRYSISTIPGLSVPLVLFAMYRGGTTWPLLWTAFYLGLTALVWWLWRRFVQDEARLTPADLLAKWRPPLDRLALLHGLGVGSAVLLTLALPFFLRFLLASWGLILLHVTRSFPEQWPYWLVLGLLFVLGLYRHAVAAHRFVFEQLRLEEHSQELSRHLGAAKEAAEAALHDRNRFLSTASHDLRQPVHAMGMLVAALQARNRDAALAPLLSDLGSSVDSVSLIFNSLLDLSRLQAGTLVARPAPVALPPLLNEIATLYRAQADRQGLRLRTWRPPGDCVVQADAHLLRQALINLTHNALRYTPRGGVLLGVRRRGAHWLIEVWDTGVGVAASDQARIFAPGHRAAARAERAQRRRRGPWPRPGGGGAGGVALGRGLRHALAAGPRLVLLAAPAGRRAAGRTPHGLVGGGKRAASWARRAHWRALHGGRRRAAGAGGLAPAAARLGH